MRRFAILVAVLGLTACGGEVLPEEGQVAEESLCTGNSWECMCAQYKTEATCAGVKGCFWYQNRCQPTYE